MGSTIWPARAHDSAGNMTCRDTDGEEYESVRFCAVEEVVEAHSGVLLS